MDKVPFLLASLLTWFSPQVVAAEPQRIVCPETLTVTETAPPPDPAWEIAVDGGRPGFVLEGVTFYLGHPKELASLVPDRSERRSRHEERSVWKLVKEPGKAYWIGCSYSNTHLLAARKVPEEATSCQVVRQILPSGATLRIKEITCR